MDLHVKLDATDAAALCRLRDAYGRDGTTLIRDLIREKYAELYEEVPEGSTDEMAAELQAVRGGHRR